MERISATLPVELEADWRRFHRGGGSGTAFMAHLAERAERADRVPGLEAEIVRLRAAPNGLQAVRAAAAREAADFVAESDAHDRERAAWAAEQRQHDAALLATDSQVAGRQALLDELDADWDAKVQRLLAEAADGLDAEIDRRAEERSWAHCVMHLDNPWILDRVTRAGMDAGKFNAAIDERAAVLLRQHLADAREAAKKKKQAEALDAIRAQGRAERARYRY